MSSVPFSLEDLNIPANLFTDVVFYATGKIDIKYLNLLEKGGAKQRNYAGSAVTHVFVGDDAEDLQIEEAKDIFEIPVVRPEWIAYSAKLGRVLSVDGFCGEKEQLFSPVVASVSEISGQDLKSLWASIVFYGGKLKLELTNDATHLICNNCNSPTYATAKQRNIKVVCIDWVSDSIKQEKLAECALYDPLLLRSPSPPKPTTTVVPSSQSVSTAPISTAPVSTPTLPQQKQPSQSLPTRPPQTPATNQEQLKVNQPQAQQQQQHLQQIQPGSNKPLAQTSLTPANQQQHSQQLQPATNIMLQTSSSPGMQQQQLSQQMLQASSSPAIQQQQQQHPQQTQPATNIMLQATSSPGMQQQHSQQTQSGTNIMLQTITSSEMQQSQQTQSSSNVMLQTSSAPGMQQPQQQHPQQMQSGSNVMLQTSSSPGMQQQQQQHPQQMPSGINVMLQTSSAPGMQQQQQLPQQLQSGINVMLQTSSAPGMQQQQQLPQQLQSGTNIMLQTSSAPGMQQQIYRLQNSQNTVRINSPSNVNQQQQILSQTLSLPVSHHSQQQQIQRPLHHLQQQQQLSQVHHQNSQGIPMGQVSTQQISLQTAPGQSFQIQNFQRPQDQQAKLNAGAMSLRQSPSQGSQQIQQHPQQMQSGTNVMLQTSSSPGMQQQQQHPQQMQSGSNVMLQTSSSPGMQQQQQHPQQMQSGINVMLQTSSSPGMQQQHSQQIQSGTNIMLQTSSSPGMQQQHSQQIQSGTNIMLQTSSSPGMQQQHSQQIQSGTNIMLQTSSSPGMQQQHSQQIQSGTNIMLQTSSSPGMQQQHSQQIQSGTNIMLQTSSPGMQQQQQQIQSGTSVMLQTSSPGMQQQQQQHPQQMPSGSNVMLQTSSSPVMQQQQQHPQQMQSGINVMLQTSSAPGMQQQQQLPQQLQSGTNIMLQTSSAPGMQQQIYRLQNSQNTVRINSPSNVNQQQQILSQTLSLPVSHHSQQQQIQRPLHHLQQQQQLSQVHHQNSQGIPMGQVSTQQISLQTAPGQSFQIQNFQRPQDQQAKLNAGATMSLRQSLSQGSQQIQQLGQQQMQQQQLGQQPQRIQFQQNTGPRLATSQWTQQQQNEVIRQIQMDPQIKSQWAQMDQQQRALLIQKLAQRNREENLKQEMMLRQQKMQQVQQQQQQQQQKFIAPGQLQQTPPRPQTQMIVTTQQGQSAGGVVRTQQIFTPQVGQQPLNVRHVLVQQQGQQQARIPQQIIQVQPGMPQQQTRLQQQLIQVQPGGGGIQQQQQQPRIQQQLIQVQSGMPQQQPRLQPQLIQVQAGGIQQQPRMQQQLIQVQAGGIQQQPRMQQQLIQVQPGGGIQQQQQLIQVQSGGVSQQQHQQQQQQHIILQQQQQIPVQVVNSKTKTALANLLSNRLQGTSVPEGPSGQVTGASSPVMTVPTPQPPQVMCPPPPPVNSQPPPPPSPQQQQQQQPSPSQALASPQHTPPSPQQNILVQRRTLTTINNGPKAVAAGSRITGDPGQQQISPSNLPLPPPRAQFYGHDPNIKLPTDGFLLGCVFWAPVSLSLPNWHLVVEQYGGQCEKNYSPRVTHILCDNQKFPEFQQVLREGKRMITLHWLNDICLRKCVAPPYYATHLPVPFTESDPPLKNKKVTICGFSVEDRTRVKIMLKTLGAELFSSFSQSVDALVAHKPEGKKYTKAREWKIPVVNIQFLNELMFGQFSVLEYIHSPKYQHFNPEQPFRFDISLVGFLMSAWKIPIRVSSESFEVYKVRKRTLESKSDNTDGNNEPKRSRLTGELIDMDMEPLSPDVTKSDNDSSMEVDIKEEIKSENEENIVKEEYPFMGKKPTVVMISGYTRLYKDKIKEKILHLGGRVTEDCREATHLIIKKSVRTKKLFIGLSRVRYIVNHEWLVKSLDKKKFVDATPYILSNECIEKTYGVKICDVLAKPNRNLLFAGVTFYITPSCLPSVPELQEIIEAAGGQVDVKQRSMQDVRRQARKTPRKYVIITCTKDFHMIADACKQKHTQGLHIHTPEFIFESITKQKFKPMKTMAKLHLKLPDRNANSQKGPVSSAAVVPSSATSQ